MSAKSECLDQFHWGSCYIIQMFVFDDWLVNVQLYEDGCITWTGPVGIVLPHIACV